MVSLRKNSDAKHRRGAMADSTVQRPATKLRPLGLLCVCAGALLLGACASGPDYVYRFEARRTAILRDGIAIAPPGAPRAVKAAIAAGNRIAGKPYKSGGGHRRVHDSGYDCSGAVSYVLGSARLLRSPMTSSGFRRYGRSGAGRWITVHATRGHVFIVVAGLRFDTGWTGTSGSGPRWTTRRRPAREFALRHPPGL